MINAELVNREQIQVRIENLPNEVKPQLVEKLRGVLTKLKNLVQDKLSNKVLNVRSGNLKSSIATGFEDNDGVITGLVISKQSSLRKSYHYGAYHEYGGVVNVKSHIRKNARTGIEHIVGAHTRNVPERSFMRSSLAEMEREIVEEIKKAVDIK